MSGYFNRQPVLYVRRDGKIIEGHLSAAMIYDDDGNEAATVGSFVDLTERIEYGAGAEQNPGAAFTF